MNKVTDELIENIKNELPNISSKIGDKALQRVILTTLTQLNKTVTETIDEKTNIVKLGRFIKKEVEKDGEKTLRILFRPTQPKAE